MNTSHHKLILHVSVLALLALSLPARAQEADPGAAATPEAAPAPPAAPATSTPSAPSNEILLNFQNASLATVLNYLSEAAGFVIVQEAPVSGTVNVVSRQPIDAEEAVDLLNAVLVEKGYVALRSGRILKIVSRRDAQKRDLPVITGSDPEQIPRKDQMVTQILPIRYAEAAKLIDNLRPLLAAEATLTSNESSNALLLTDTQTNIRRIAQIISALDTSISGVSTIRVYPLQYADAKQLATVITSLFATPTTGGQQQGGGGGFGRRGFGGGGQQQPAQAESAARQANSRVVAVADEQSNSVIVSAPEEVLPTITELVTQVDTTIVDSTQTQIFRLEHADAMEVATILTTLYADVGTTQNQQQQGGRGQGGRGQQQQQQQGSTTSQRSLLQARVVAVADPRTNSVVVNAARDTLTEIALTIGRLDHTDAKRQRVYVHKMEHADVENVATVLGTMFGSGNQTSTATSRLAERAAAGASSDVIQTTTTGGRTGN